MAGYKLENVTLENDSGTSQDDDPIAFQTGHQLTSSETSLNSGKWAFELDDTPQLTLRGDLRLPGDGTQAELSIGEGGEYPQKITYAGGFSVFEALSSSVLRINQGNWSTLRLKAGSTIELDQTVDAKNNQLTNLADGTSAQDAATVSQLSNTSDTHIDVSDSGGTFLNIEELEFTNFDGNIDINVKQNNPPPTFAEIDLAGNINVTTLDASNYIETGGEIRSSSSPLNIVDGSQTDNITVAADKFDATSYVESPEFRPDSGSAIDFTDSTGSANNGVTRVETSRASNFIALRTSSSTSVGQAKAENVIYAWATGTVTDTDVNFQESVNIDTNNSDVTSSDTAKIVFDGTFNNATDYAILGTSDAGFIRSVGGASRTSSQFEFVIIQNDGTDVTTGGNRFNIAIAGFDGPSI